jgi:hypothetical protein
MEIRMTACFYCKKEFEKDEMKATAGKLACPSCMSGLDKSVKGIDEAKLSREDKIDKHLVDVSFCKALMILLAILMSILLWVTL